MEYVDFEKSFKFLAEVCGKANPKESMMRFFWAQVYLLDASAIKASFSFFASDAKWPTANEFAKHCGGDGRTDKHLPEFERGLPRFTDEVYLLRCFEKGATLDAQEQSLAQTVEIHGARGDYYAIRNVDGVRKNSWERHIFGKPKQAPAPKVRTPMPKRPDQKLAAAGDKL
jgi:hypothetical protein